MTNISSIRISFLVTFLLISQLSHALNPQTDLDRIDYTISSSTIHTIWKAAGIVSGKLRSFNFEYEKMADGLKFTINEQESNTKQVLTIGAEARDDFPIEHWLVDVNSDGYKDLLFLTSCGASGIYCSYTLYYFDPLSKKFITNEKLKYLENVSLNLKKKQVITTHSCLRFKNGEWIIENIK